MLVREIQTCGVRARLAVEIPGQGDARMGQTQGPFTGGHLLDLLHRILHQIREGDVVVRDAVDEGGVGPVLQQAAHQVGEQGLVAAHRSIDAAGATQLAVGHLADHLFVQGFTHAVQALELVLARVVVLTRQLIDGRQGVGVVGGELGIDGLGHRQQLAGAGEVGDVRVGLAGIDRVAFQPFLLGALDLAVPVGALHQTDHQAVTAALGEIDDVVDHIGAALLVGLDDEADAVPVGEGRIEAELFQQIEGDLQAIGLLGVDVDADVILPGELGQAQQGGVELLHDAIVLGAAVARMQGGEFDGDTRPLVDAATVGGLADSVDGLLVGGQIAFRVLLGQGRFPQHVVGVAEPFALHAACVRQRLGDGLAGDELFTHQAHRHVDALADERLTPLADESLEGAVHARLVVGGHQLAGDEQTPGGRVDEQ